MYIYANIYILLTAHEHLAVSLEDRAVRLLLKQSHLDPKTKQTKLKDPHKTTQRQA